MIRVLDGTEQDGARFHHATQNGMQFKTYELFISGNFHLIFLDHGWVRVTETTEIETVDKGRNYCIAETTITWCIPAYSPGQLHNLAMGENLGTLLSNPQILYLLKMVTRWQPCSGQEALFRASAGPLNLLSPPAKRKRIRITYNSDNHNKQQ